MALTRPFAETIRARASTDPGFRAALLAEVLELIADNDVPTAKVIIRDYILAVIGYESLAKKVGKKPESIKRMLSVKGNPTIANMAAILCSLKHHEGIELRVEATR